MNSDGKSRYSGRPPYISLRVARIAAAGLISVSSLALTWATSRNVGSTTEIDTKPAQPRSLHPKPPSGTRRHGSPAGHHAGKQGAKFHNPVQQSAQNGVSKARNSTRGKHGNHPKSGTTPTPTPEETPTPSPLLIPGTGPMTSPVSDIDSPPAVRRFTSRCGKGGRLHTDPDRDRGGASLTDRVREGAQLFPRCSPLLRPASSVGRVAFAV